MGLPPAATGWELAIQLAKLPQYLGIAGLAGGTVCLLFYRDDRRRTVLSITSYIGLCALIGFNGALFGFLFQVGMTSGGGLADMFDPDMARLLLGFETGSAALLRLAGFLVPAAACAVFASRLGNRPPTRAQYRALGAAHAGALLLLLASFALTGHIAVLQPVARISIALHVLAASVWIGSFPPLLYLCLNSEREAAAAAMKGFGDMAGYCLLVLFSAGLVLALELFHAPGELISTPYGIALLVKLGLAGMLLCAAAGNRFVLVPRMLSGAGAGKLAVAISVEIVLAAAILAVTSYLATAVGPPAQPM